MWTGWEGGEWRNPRGGCQETAVWEQGQERVSWQQLLGAKSKPLDWTQEESVGGNERTKQAVSVPILGQSLPFLHDRQT